MLPNIEFVLLSLSCTSINEPVDAEIIAAFRLRYKRGKIGSMLYIELNWMLRMYKRLIC